MPCAARPWPIWATISDPTHPSWRRPCWARAAWPSSTPHSTASNPNSPSTWGASRPRASCRRCAPPPEHPMNPLRILLLCHSFNSLTQRLFAELRAAGHTLSVELDIADAVTEEAVALFRPDLVLAPFLQRRIPVSVWSRVVCLVVHPGVPGDRGPSALDWMLMRGDTHWGVTVLQAVHDYDAGDVWAWEPFAVRPGATKSSVYRREVTQAAGLAALRA